MKLSTEAKVGTVSLIGLLLLALITVQLGEFTFGETGYPIHAVFKHVDGLAVGNLVRYAGVEVGRVQGVKVLPDGVNVRLLIYSGVQIPQGARFNISTDGLLGEKFVNIAPPPTADSFIQPNSTVQGENPHNLDQFIASAEKVLANLDRLIDSFNEVFGDPEVKAALKGTTLNAQEVTANLNQLSATLARLVENNEQDVQHMIKNLHEVSNSLRQTAERVDKLVAEVDNGGQTARDLREAIANIKSTSARVENMAASLEGVITDPQTAADLKATLHNAREVSAKANKILASVDSAETSVEMLYNRDADRYQSNALVKFNTSPRNFAVVGVTDIGEGNKANLQLGHGTEHLAGRVGVIDGEAGIGLDTKLGKQLKLSLDAYDPNDVRLKLRAKLQLAPDIHIVGQVDNLNEDNESTSLGISKSF